MSYIHALDQFIQATNTHDFENVKPLLHSKATFWFADKTYATTNEIQQYFEKTWSLIKEEVYSIADVEWIAVDEKAATCIYKYHYEGYYNDRFISGNGRATNVFVKDPEGTWKLIHEHLSSL